MTTLYTAEATATGAGRGGHVRSTDAALDLDLSIPKELGGAGGAGTNPEQLFAAGFAACFHSALQVVARREKVALDGTSVTGAVGIGPDGVGYGLTVALTVDLPGIEREQGEALIAAAHQVCPYSNATRGNIDVQLTLA
ncbi:organic hydroperoxide resistance protein [Nocardia cyriacigeorgica]|jgi:lipoyl-dependent peroxiredoxin|uniref:Ohr, organic hydroperoxide resistance protein n=1 Tax=Nocardia cyriacigeorgica (strain GUH-2) TaxID=1127134 RepID=H6R0C9_NOCCG|nr:organic hydroperoxide resistance protein [Nocardia cyriacigeorgica]AVH23244.1 organic hydroperoxide resistance protein [Nocardia cyriacigeorgica]MBF6322781.1 organic hydroperoxide resistance protein [Nocardia cyriacigeorgica]MBF6423454.1 organic hydroperoxide resistance protein [Nocardia cyriacigeorgica]PPJ10326.1 organic hydroperoxide resistance protein [Nocardia cyriacigeorgica]TLF55923.1 organic hydroperoxide resistance protein [Nocardia cyriacigeorgica]